MESEDAVVLLAAAPATAYREYLYRPDGRLAQWIQDRFEVLATPGQPARDPVRDGDVLLEVTLGGRGGVCVRVGQADRDRFGRGLPPGRLLLRPRRPAQLTEPQPVEPQPPEPHPVEPHPAEPRPAEPQPIAPQPVAPQPVAPQRVSPQPVAPQPGEPLTAEPGPAAASVELPGPEPWLADPTGGEEHDFGDDDGGATPVRVDAAAAVPPFAAAERATVAQPLLSATASADAVAWTRRMHPAVSGVGTGDIRAALGSYVDASAVQAAIERRDRRAPDPDAVLVECVHQFQLKCYRERGDHDGRAGESTLDSLGLIVRAGSGFRGADRGNAAAQRRLNAIEDRVAALTGHEFTAASWFDAMTDPAVLGERTKLGNGLHVLLVRRLRQAERYLLTLPAYRGMTPVALGAALRLGEAHGGARPSQATSLSVHTFGLAVDIAYRKNPWIRSSASWRALQHAAALGSGTRLDHANAPAYFFALGSAGRSTGEVWDELQRRNTELISYLRLGEDPAALRAALQAGQTRGTPGLLEPNETVEQAAERWQARISQDREGLSATDFHHHVPPGQGFLSLPRDLVIALRDHACLAWGAVDLGPGSNGSGDMMHFDARIGGVGQALATSSKGTPAERAGRGVNYVPTSGHPCVTGRTRPAEAAAQAEAAVEQAPGEVTDYLGGRLWTFTPQGYGLPVAVFVPPAALSRESVEVLVFAHGLLTGCPRLRHVPAGFVTERPFALGSVVHGSGRPVVLVVPLLDWLHPGGGDAFGRGHERWHALARPDRLNDLVDQVLGEVGRVRGTATPGLATLLVAGHSRAYDFLEPLADSRQQEAVQRGALAKLSRVWAFDTTYAGRVGNWVDWVSVNPRLGVHVFFRPHTKTEAVGESFHRRRRPGLAVTPVYEQHCDVPATRLRELLDEPAEPAGTEAADAEAADAGAAEATVTEAVEAEAGEAEAGAAEAGQAQAGEADATPSAAELTGRIARCVGIWETNRGGDQPAPRESGLDTVAGVHASMATIEQATMPYAITVLRRHKALRDRAQPPLTLKELNAADARVGAVGTLLNAVAAAAAQGTAPDDFLAGSRPGVAATGLGDDDVRTMFRAETLRGSLRQARTDMEAAGRAAADRAAAAHRSPKEQAAAALAARQKSLAASLAAITDRVGLNDSSLRAYATRPPIWGENRAGWQRRAVQAMPGDLARRIEDVATADNGTALALPTIRSRVDAELAKTPTPEVEDVVRAVAQQNNPHEAEYGRHVWQTYQRLYP